MNEKILQDKIARLQARDLSISDHQAKQIKIKDILYLVSEKRTIKCFTKDSSFILKGTLKSYINFFTKSFSWFKQTHSRYLVNLSVVKHTTSAPSGYFLLFSEDSSIKALVSHHYKKEVCEFLGVQTLSHITPQSSYRRRLKSLRLITFGEEEFATLNRDDKKAVQAFKEKWDIRYFSRYKMFKYFKTKTTNKLDKVMIVRNLIWQAYTWINWKLIPPIDGTIRTLWYSWVGVVLSKFNLLSGGDHDQSAIYLRLQDFIELDLFQYKDFGFEDPLYDTRMVSDLNWHLFLFAEKQGIATFTRRLAETVGGSYLASSGQVPWITAEYLSDELKTKLEDEERKLQIFVIVDFNPDGFNISQSFLRLLHNNGIKNVNLTHIVSLDLFSELDIEHKKKAILSYREYERNGKIIRKPLTHADKYNMTETLKWFEGFEGDDQYSSWPGVKDQRLIKRVPHKKGGETVTIYGLDADVLERTKVRKRFLELVKPHLKHSLNKIEKFNQLKDLSSLNFLSTFKGDLYGDQ